MASERYGTKVNLSGPGVVKPCDGFPGMMISDTLFVFDINPDVVIKLKEFYKNNDVYTTSIFQLEKYKDISLFKQGLKDLIFYAIFENQDLCDKCFVIAPTMDIVNAANEVWPSEAKAITKFRGRKWPTEKFVSDFIPMVGCGTISPSPSKIDMDNLVTWFYEIGYKEEMTTETFSFDPENPDNIPIPLEPGVPMPPIPEPPSSGSDSEGGTSVTYSIIYYEWNEYTSFPVTENAAKILGTVVAANTRPQNSATVHVRKQDHVEIIAQVSGGSE